MGVTNGASEEAAPGCTESSKNRKSAVTMKQIIRVASHVKQTRLVDRCGSEATAGEMDGKNRENGCPPEEKGSRREVGGSLSAGEQYGRSGASVWSTFQFYLRQVG